MGFFIRAGLLVGIGILLIPADQDEIARSGDAQKATALSTLSFAKAALDDLRGFCGRNPDACETGSALADGFNAKARTAAKWVYTTLAPETTRQASAPAPAPAAPVPPAGAAPVPTAHAAIAGDPIATGTVKAKPEPKEIVVPVPKPKPDRPVTTS
ncbi:DUF5330 domain-containing protein [Prosthecomicrobium sp. N25]|uniref:DUF5330 domain-containing protein n=1 Tax=Prosthecomicrobium sp. N25 TaxID=3129254 RepID=UPI003077A436